MIVRIVVLELGVGVVQAMDMNTSKVRWGDRRRADSDFAREQILDAALRCFEKLTYQKTRMEHIASEAKVSRQTIYRYFPNRDEVVMGVIMRELYSFVDLFRERVDATASFAEFVVETLAVADEAVQSSPVLGLLLRETTVWISRPNANLNDIFTLFNVYFRERFDAAKAAGELREGIEFDTFTDWVSHVGASFMMVPRLSDSCDFRYMLWHFLMPAIVHEKVIPLDKRS